MLVNPVSDHCIACRSRDQVSSESSHFLPWNVVCKDTIITYAQFNYIHYEYKKVKEFFTFKSIIYTQVLGLSLYAWTVI